MNDDARERFRTRYRANISPYYSGWIHLFTLLLAGGGLIYFGIDRLVDFRLSELWMIYAAGAVLNSR